MTVLETKAEAKILPAPKRFEHFERFERFE